MPCRRSRRTSLLPIGSHLPISSNWKVHVICICWEARKARKPSRSSRPAPAHETETMNFELSAEQVMLREMLHRFVAEQCDRDTVRDVVDGTSTWSHRLWREMQTIDLLGTGIAEEDGGAGGKVKNG